MSPERRELNVAYSVGSVSDIGAVTGAKAKPSARSMDVSDVKTDTYYQICDSEGNVITGITVKQGEDDAETTLEPDANGWYHPTSTDDMIVTGLAPNTTYQVKTILATDYNANSEQQDENKTATTDVTTAIDPLNPTGTEENDGIEVNTTVTSGYHKLTITGLDQ